MTRINFERVSGILLDRCHDHGIWFDATELDAVLRFIKLGGERAASERREEEERARASELRIKPQPKSPEDGGKLDFGMYPPDSQLDAIPWIMQRLLKL